MIKFATQDLLTRERLLEVLRYDAETGLFTYRIRTSQRTKSGDVAGSINANGYRHIRVDGRIYKAHRLAWLWMAGEFPEGIVDHINGVRSDNRFANLRLASRSQNLANSTLHRAGKVAPKGVRQLSDGKWTARIQRDKQSVFLGRFDDVEAASNAYRAAAHSLFGEFARA